MATKPKPVIVLQAPNLTGTDTVTMVINQAGTYRIGKETVKLKKGAVIRFTASGWTAL